MSKEYIEALNYVWYHYYTEELDQDEVDEIEKNLNVVQDGLKRLESIDNAEPSEALECLERVEEITKAYSIDLVSEFALDLDTIKQALQNAQKEHKALEIIKEKNVDILDVKLYENYEHYCRAKEDSRLRKDWWLTEEEFNLLKEVLE